MTTWIQREAGPSGRYLVCPALENVRLPHAFTLRAASTEAPGGEGPVLRAAGLPAGAMARCRQVHGAAVAILRREGDLPATEPAEADAILVTQSGRGAAVGTADCVGAILALPEPSAFVVLHAGWRGILAGVVEQSVSALARATGAAPREMILATGPSAGRCCYEVGPEVEAPFADLFAGGDGEIFGRRNGRATIGLAAAAGALALRAGLRADAVHRSGICTICRQDLCWSFRGQRGAAGRMLAAAALP